MKHMTQRNFTSFSRKLIRLNGGMDERPRRLASETLTRDLPFGLTLDPYSKPRNIRLTPAPIEELEHCRRCDQ
jgi:hypothetical protein